MSSTAPHDASVAESEKLTYTVALRALGAWLDSRGPIRGVRIFETLDGFVVQQWSDEGPAGDTDSVLSFHEVWDLDSDKRLRKRSGSKDGGYRALLGAIGYELDEADAHTMLFEEVDENVVLTFLYPHYVGGFALLKQFTIITPEARTDLLRAAQDRRSPSRLAQGFSRLMGDA